MTFVLVVVLMLGTKLSLAAVVFYDDAEDAPNTSYDWVIGNNYGSQALTVSTEKARGGIKSYKFVFGGSSTGSSRVELRLSGLKATLPVRNFSLNQEYWMGWSVYLPKDFIFPDNSSNVWGLLGQFHGTADSCESASVGPNVGCFLGSDTDGFALKIRADSNRCTSGSLTRAKGYLSPKLIKGGWNDIVLNFRYNYVDSGNPFFKMWLNGQLVADDKGPNCYNDALPPYFKLGIYSNSATPMTAYYDEIRVGDENSSYNEVAQKAVKLQSRKTVQILRWNRLY